MRLLFCVTLLGCAAPRQELGLSALAVELRDLPECSASIEHAYRTLQAQASEVHSSWIFIQRSAPLPLGSVVEVWRDRLAVALDKGVAQPAVGSFLVVGGAAGYKADAYVVRVRDRIAFGQKGLHRPGIQISPGDRVIWDGR